MSTYNSNQNNTKKNRGFIDVFLIVLVYAMSIFGIYCISIATFNPDKGTELSLFEYIANSNSATWQTIFMAASTVGMGAMLVIPLEFYKARARLIYYSVLFLLVGTLVFATAVSGVNAWLSVGWGRTIQPCEFAKISVLIMLAKILSAQEKPMGTFKDFMRVIMVVGVPALVTLLQKETGSVIVIGVMFIVVLYFSGINQKIFWAMVTPVLLGIVGLLVYALVSGSGDYRMMRILAFLEPEKYPQDAYQLLESQKSIGSGGLTGIGVYVVGSMSQLDYVPEDHTDFIFAPLGEAFGFVTCALVLLLYLALLLRLLYLAYYTHDKFGRLIIVGVMAMFFFHIFENIAMTTGLMPITGIPLPFLSYGGTNYLTNIACIALVLNVTKNRKPEPKMEGQGLQIFKPRKKRFWRKA